MPLPKRIMRVMPMSASYAIWLASSVSLQRASDDDRGIGLRETGEGATLEQDWGK